MSVLFPELDPRTNGIAYAASQQKKEDSVTTAAKKALQSQESPSRAHIYHYLGAAATAIAAAVCVVAFVFFAKEILLVAAFGLIILAALNLIEGVMAHRSLKPAESAVKVVKEDPIQMTAQALRNPTQETASFEFEKLEKVGRKSSTGVLNPFTSAIEVFQRFPYRLMKKEMTEEEIFTHYVQTVLGLAEGQDPVARMNECLADDGSTFYIEHLKVVLGCAEDEIVERLKACLEGPDNEIKRLVTELSCRLIQGPESIVDKAEAALNRVQLRRKALHLHAFFQVIGNTAPVAPMDLQSTLVSEHNLMLMPSIDLAKARIVPLMVRNFGEESIAFTIRGDCLDVVPVVRSGESDTPPEARFQVERAVIIFPPDHAGGVAYTTTQKYAKVPQ